MGTAADHAQERQRKAEAAAAARGTGYGITYDIHYDSCAQGLVHTVCALLIGVALPRVGRVLQCCNVAMLQYCNNAFCLNRTVPGGISQATVVVSSCYNFGE